jgi:putative endonuclease
VYLVRCADGALYTGIATDVPRRLDEHQGAAGRGARALRGRGPLSLVLQHRVGARGLAQRVEASIKRLPKADKEALVAEPARLKPILARARRAQRRAVGGVPSAE